MKTILLAVFSLPFLAIAQDCKIFKDTDPYTKETKLSTGFIGLQNGASLTIDADKKEIDFFFVVPDKCFNDQTTIFIYFEGSKAKTTYRNAGSMNCNGDFHIILRNGTVTPTFIKKLSAQKVSQFVFTVDKKQTIISLLPDQQEAVMNAIACLDTEAKTLTR